MAVTDPLYTTQVGGSTLSATARESFEDRITIFSPQDTPFQMLAPVRQISSVSSDWMVDDIATPTTVDTEKEGEEFANLALNQARRLRLSNDVATQMRPVTVTDEARLMNEAGIVEEFAYQLGKQSLELAKQTEVNLWHSTYQARASASGAVGSGTAGRTAGLLEWALIPGLARAGGYTDNQTVGPATNSIPSTYWGNWYHVGEAAAVGSRTHVGNSTTLTRDNLISDVLAPYYRIGGDISASITFVPSLVKKHLSELGITYAASSATDIPLSRSMVGAEKKEAVWSVDAFDTDFGVMYVALCRYLEDGMPNATGTIVDTGTSNDPYTVKTKGVMFGMDPRYVRIMQLRPMDMVPVAKSGDNTKAFLRSTCGVQVDSPMALWGASSVIDDS